MSRLNTYPRRICGTRNKNNSKRKDMSYGTIDMDSYADTVVCRSNFTLLNNTSQEFDVAPHN